MTNDKETSSRAIQLHAEILFIPTLMVTNIEKELLGNSNFDNYYMLRNQHHFS